MSYLNPLRLHFAGQFQAAVSTVNNDPVHYDNSRFQARFQDRQTQGALNGWFNPRGDAAWRLLGCRVTGAWTGAGSAASAEDPVRTYLVADSDSNVPAKLADLDPAQQLVSTVFGLEVRITTATGDTLVRGRFEPAPFTDIWSRTDSPAPGDADAGACYQSVLTDLEWGEAGSSPFLAQLRQAAAADELLSIKFNVDSFNMNFRSPDFMRGRITGTIGPAAADEPHHLVVGRHFLTTSRSAGGFFAPAGNVNNCVARVDDASRKVYVDLGNALPIDASGAPADQGAVTLACIAATDDGPRAFRIDDLAAATYTDPGWYAATAGVVELPVGRPLTDDELAMVASNPLALATAPPPAGTPAVAISEPPGGAHVRADRFVFRLSPGERAEARLYASRFGVPCAGARIIVVFDPSGLQSGGSPDLGPAPDVATPVDALEYPALVVADGTGVAVLPLGATDPGNPRGYIDGQVYGLRPVLEETVYSPWAPYPFNPSDFVSVLVWDDFRPDEEPLTWFGSLQPVLQQFENLYPVMKRFVRLGDYESVCENRDALIYAFGLDVTDPNYMPVTRDLSPAKSAALLRWLTALGPDGKPLMGVPPAGAGPAPSPAVEAFAGVDTAPPEARAGAHEGGKAAAVGRRLAETSMAATVAGTVVEGLE